MNTEKHFNMNIHEEQIINFIVKEKKERVLQMLLNSKNRKKFLRELSHYNSFDNKYVYGIPSNRQTPESIHEQLNILGAQGECYVISGNQALDCKHFQLKDALKEIVGYDYGTIISCIPGELAYYEGEDERLILKNRLH